MAQLFANAARSTLTASITSTATQLQINPADQAKFPVASGADYFKVAVEDASGNIEFVKVQRAVGQSILNVVSGGRQAEDATNFPARSFVAGSLVELRMTAADLVASIAHPSVNTGAHAASAISFTPAGAVAASTVQTAIEELDTEKASATALAYKAATGENNDITKLLALSTVPDVVATAIEAEGDAAVAAAGALDRQYRQVGQIATFQTGAFASGTTVIPGDNTIPQSTEGDQYLSVTLTPTNAGSLLVVDVLLSCGTNVPTTAVAALFRDSGAGALSVTASTMPVTGEAFVQLSLQLFVTAGSTASTTFKVRAGATGGGGTFCVNGAPNTGAKFGGVGLSRITVTEYLP